VVFPHRAKSCGEEYGHGQAARAKAASYPPRDEEDESSQGEVDPQKQQVVRLPRNR
jgi:hypothetical protein